MEFTGERFVLGKATGGIETEHLHRYMSISNLVSGKKVLDAACGEGFGASILAKTAGIVWGIDISSEAIEYANNNYRSYNLHYKQGTVEKLEFEDNSFDVVVSFETIEHVDEEVQHKFLLEIKRVLKDDGLLIISTPDKFLHTDIPNHINQFHVKEFYYGEFIDFLKNYFSHTDLYNQMTRNFGLIVNYNKNFRTNIEYLKQGHDNQPGKYIIAICSNLETENKTILNSLLEEKFVEIEENSSDFFQIYLDNDKSFIEYNSAKTKYNYCNQYQTLSFSVPDHSYGKLRLDIGNRPCIMELKKKFTFKSKDIVYMENIEIIDTAGIICLDENEEYIKLISMSEDPQLILGNRIDKEKVEELMIFIEIKVKEFEFSTSLIEINNLIAKYRLQN